MWGKTFRLFPQKSALARSDWEENSATFFLKIGKTPHPTPYTPHPVPTKRLFQQTLAKERQF
ncbi:hypothetical protein [Microcystis sp. M037S2]|uniref:hypothetical protein n=1 Tax=Microcystis sp. M037S2 TaxID=2771163 RepID=UPI0025879A69|nr:hypothetical protein [Microcystis sp. M037S2]MCA2689811.1 hypothetical protein [Microcystis sp. M037S2]MCA2736607.1 hypothetical protein [Microcystis sp. M158S2]